jgi:superfamily II DNA or RNA helicase
MSTEMTEEILPDFTGLLEHPDLQLREGECGYATAEKQCRIALRALKHVCNGAKSWDGWGFNKHDAASGFIRDMLSQERSYTPNQLSALYKVLSKYRRQLTAMDVPLPLEEEIIALREQKQAAQTNTQPAHPIIDVDIEEGYIYFFSPFKTKAKFDDFRVEYAQRRESEGGKWCGRFGRFSQEARCLFMGKLTPGDVRWRIPLTPATFKLLKSNFPAHTVELTATAQAYQRKLEEHELALIKAAEEISEAKQRHYEKLLASLGGIECAIDPTGQKRLYEHQIKALEIMLRRERFICADETGLGKTYEAAVAAKAWQRTYGYHIYIVTTVSSMGMWLEVAKELDITVEVYSWAKMPKADNEYPPKPFIIIADEAHNAQSMSSARTRNLLALAWHKNCKVFYALTGTPSPNGRPINTYPLLLAAQHPYVWGSGFPRGVTYPLVWKKKDDTGSGSVFPYRMHELSIAYQDKFCGRQLKHIGSGEYVYDSNGSTNEFIWNQLFIYDTKRDDNHRDACIIARKKMDCVDLPEKQRIPQPVEMSKAAENVFWQSFQAMWERFNSNVATKLETFKKEYKEKNSKPAASAEIRAEEARIRKAEAIVEYGSFRHAGAIAKIEYAHALAEKILDGGSKLVIFTSFRDVAAQLGALIEETTGKRVGFIVGGMKPADRDSAVADFQSPTGSTQVMISTAAGGEAITLTAAQYMLIIDRPWTPGKVKQWEDRIHRLTTTGQVSIYWLQLPASLTLADIKVDAIIEHKQVKIDALIYGETTTGLEFVDELNDQAFMLLAETAKKIHRKSK